MKLLQITTIYILLNINPCTCSENQLDVPVVYRNQDALANAIEDELLMIDVHINASTEERDLLLKDIFELFPHESKHPSKLNFPSYARSMEDIAIEKVEFRDTTHQAQLKAYFLPPSEFPEETEKRQKACQYIIQLRSPGNLCQQVLQTMQKDLVITKIVQLVFHYSAAPIIARGLAGPYLRPCDHAWERAAARARVFQELCETFFQIENDLLRWYYNSKHGSHDINIQDYAFFMNLWGNNKVDASKSGQFSDKLNQLAQINQTIIAAELYLRGYIPQDIRELLNNNIELTTNSWINILAILFMYAKEPSLNKGIYSFSHPDLMRQALLNCITNFFPRRVKQAIIDMKSPHEEKALDPRSNDELDIGYIKLLRKNLSTIGKRCQELDEKHRDNPVFCEQKLLLTRLIGATLIASDLIVYAIDCKNPRLITDEDKEAYFKMLELLQMYIPNLDLYLQDLRDGPATEYNMPHQ